MDSDLTVFTISGSCSDAVDALCAHLGLAVIRRERKLHAAALADVNPQRTVPTLVTEGNFVLTETSAILNHIARQHAVELLGRGPLERARNEEMLSFLATGVNSAFLLHFRPDRSADSDEGRNAVREKAAGTIDAALDMLEARVLGRKFAAGDHLTTSDFLLLVMLNWAQVIDPALLHNRPRLKAQHVALRAMPFHDRAFANRTA
jgi:glutathione S-transferase